MLISELSGDSQAVSHMCAVLVLLKMLLQTDRRMVIEFWPKRLICRVCRLQMLQIYIWSSEKVTNSICRFSDKITSEATVIMASSGNSQDYNVSDEMEIEGMENKGSGILWFS